jgi:uncharacterized membrane protein YhhN
MVVFPIAFGALAGLDWLAVGCGWQRVERFAKPAAMLALIAWLSLAAGWQGQRTWFALALVFSLVGDIFLLFPQRGFLYGLVAFLAAHLCYLVGFNPAPLPPGWEKFLLLMGVAAAAVPLGRKILNGVGQHPETRALQLPVAVYSLVISLMLLSAALTLLRPDWPRPAAWMATSGAALFFASDSLLAWDRFVRPRQHARLLVMMTYHLGQFLLISGVLLRYPRV